jgi:hypothetical protein
MAVGRAQPAPAQAEGKEMDDKVGAFDLFLDESGTFDEMEPGKRRTQRFPSQLAGLLAPRGAMTEEDAERVLSACFASVDMPLPLEVHANQIPRGPGFDALIQGLAERVRERGWRAVRLVNREGVSYGERTTTYVHMVAELALRILENKLREGYSRVSLRFVCARVMIEDENRKGVLDQLAPAEYLRRLKEYAALAAVRRGLSPSFPLLELDGFRLDSGLRFRPLQICDLISNATHDDFKKCGVETRESLASLLDGRDHSLVILELGERVERLLAEGSFGPALRALAESLATNLDLSQAAQQAAAQRLGDVLGRLTRLPAPSRDTHLRDLANWLEEILEVQRQPALAEMIAAWLEDHVHSPLRAALPPATQPTLDWFHFALSRLRLTAANHRGDLQTAHERSEEIEALTGALAGRWEHVPLMMEGFVAQAVHLMDCFEHEKAVAKVHPVASYYENLAALFSDALPDVFPERVRSELRGKALGTQLQAEMYWGLRDPVHLDIARTLSDQALEEFVDPDHKKRQFQYRCQLETYAGDFQAARKCLAASLEVPDPVHDTIASAIKDLDVLSQGFPLLHWLRLGVYELTAGRTAGSDFPTALTRSGLLSSPWALADGLPYPAHGVRRQIALFHAVSRDEHAALSALGHLRALTPRQEGSPLLSMITIAARVEVAVLLWKPSSSAHARRLLDCTKPDRLGVIQELDAFQSSTPNHAVSLQQRLERLRSVVRATLSDSPTLSPQLYTAVIQTVRAVPY